MNDHYLVEVTFQQKYTVAIDAESPLQAVELVHGLQGALEGDQELPELLPELTRIISGN